MENNKKNVGFINIQLFAEPESTQTEVNNSINYEEEYKKQVAEIEKLKNAISKTNHENAEYKRKELEKMTEEEKRAQEYQELVDSKNKMEAELASIKLEREILANGFTNEECKELMESNMAVSVFSKILNKRIEENTKSVKAELLKVTTPDNKASSGTGVETISDFAKYQKEKEQKETRKEVKF